jgi:non-specific serine/threonine protein kinase
MIGKTLAHYEILRSLGRGGMGEVYLARDTKLGREVALKLLPDELKTDAARRARFEREAQTVASLNHPHVVTLHAVEEAEGRPFLVMEFVDGRTLDEVIDDGGLSVGRFFDLALALTEAVAAAHAKGITHRDLKPGNVMLDSSGRLKVLDFGLAKLLEEPSVTADDETIAAAATREGVIVGTAAYMSPEQAEGKPVDARSDVFSLGILLYQMVTGQKPFQGDTQMSTLTAVLRDEPRPLIELRPDLPRQLARIIRRCLEKDPERRYESARGIRYDLEILREELDSGEHERPMLDRAAPAPAGGRRLAPWLIGVAATAVVAIGAVWLAGRGGGDSDGMTAGPATAAVEATAEPTIVVFPFENMGPPEDAYFAAGITDEIVTSLTGTEGVRVLSRTSARNYDRTGKTMPEIAADLGVDYVLEGSVRWQRLDDGDSRVRVTPQLVRAATDEQVWAERYDRAMDEIFVVQSEIAGEVVRNLGATLAPEQDPASSRPTENMTAYHSYLRAVDIINTARWQPMDWERAVDLLEKSLALDPEFQLAWVMLARANSGMVHFGWDRSEQRLARARAAVDRARALAPGSVATLYAEGNYYYWGLKDYEKALAALRRANELRPNDTEVLETMAYVLRRQERYEDAAEILIDVANRSPQSSSIAIHVAETLGILQRYDEALEWAAQAIEYSPEQPLNYTMAAWIAVEAGRRDVATRHLDAVPPHDEPEVLSQALASRLELRDYPAAQRLASQLPELYEAQYLAVSRDLETARILEAMDRDDLARQHYERARTFFADRVAERPESGNFKAAHARALAGVGRYDEALVAIEATFTLFPASKDPWIATWRMLDKATIQIQAGLHEDAVQTLDDLLQHQTDCISPAMLRNSPRFDDLRERDDFRRLIAEHV